MSDRIPFQEAKALDLSTASDEKVQAAWHTYASQISYHHADDTGREWDKVPALAERMKEIETEIKRRGLPRPTGNYLISKYERIDWEQAA